MNSKIVEYAIETWMGRELRRVDTLDEAEEVKERIVRQGVTQEEQEGISEDIYIIGYDNEGKQKPVQFG